jgi:hypothetical protein
MALKHPRQLASKEWTTLMSKLDKQATPEQKRMMKIAVLNGKRIRTHS